LSAEKKPQGHEILPKRLLRKKEDDIFLNFRANIIDSETPSQADSPNNLADANLLKNEVVGSRIPLQSDALQRHKQVHNPERDSNLHFGWRVPDRDLSKVELMQLLLLEPYSLIEVLVYRFRPYRQSLQIVCGAHPYCVPRAPSLGKSAPRRFLGSPKNSMLSRSRITKTMSNK
jgi:hypothetical protein